MIAVQARGPGMERSRRGQTVMRPVRMLAGARNRPPSSRAGPGSQAIHCRLGQRDGRFCDPAAGPREPAVDRAAVPRVFEMLIS